MRVHFFLYYDQIENEYGDIANHFGNDARPYTEWCAKFADSLNIGVPWIMCQQGDAPDPMVMLLFI